MLAWKNKTRPLVVDAYWGETWYFIKKVLIVKIRQKPGWSGDVTPHLGEIKGDIYDQDIE